MAFSGDGPAVSPFFITVHNLTTAAVTHFISNLRPERRPCRLFSLCSVDRLALNLPVKMVAAAAAAARLSFLDGFEMGQITSEGSRFLEGAELLLPHHNFPC